MALIKRYPNRKLYHTEAKAYITLEEIGRLIRAGEDVHVFDYVSGDDLTTLTLTQIILEKEKQSAGFLPHSILASLVRAGGNTRSAIRRTLVNSLGFMNQVDEEIKRRIDELIKHGEFTAEEALQVSKGLLSIPYQETDDSQLPDTYDIEETLREKGVLMRDEYQALVMEIEKLSKILDGLIQ